MDDSELINEVLVLTLACQSGNATSEERARLERLLADNPRAVSWYLRIVDDTLTIVDAVAARGSAWSAPAAWTAAPAEEPPQLTTRSSALRLWIGRRRRSWFALATALAALLIAWATSRNEDAPSLLAGKSSAVGVGSARVVEVSNVAWAEGAKRFGEWSLVHEGDTLNFHSGWVNLFFENGAELLIEGPADVQFVSSQKVFARQGKLAARVGPGAVGFRIDTPHAQVTDRGTSFGVSVAGDSHTSVVVYDGIVDLDVVGNRSLPRRRLETGEALSVDRKGQLSRIMTVQSGEFLEPPQVRVRAGQPSRIITSISDNVRSLKTAKYYRVIPRGFGEDCRAYVDRMHEWNGVDDRGLPPFLVGGDYVMTFNDDKIANKISIAVVLAHPANLYVLIDDRVPPPDWLTKDFVDTGWDVGADEGFADRDIHTATGPGQSIDHVYSVWHRSVPRPDTVILGPLGVEEFTKPARDVERSMYGIVVTRMKNL